MRSSVIGGGGVGGGGGAGSLLPGLEGGEVIRCGNKRGSIVLLFAIACALLATTGQVIAATQKGDQLTPNAVEATATAPAATAPETAPVADSDPAPRTFNRSDYLTLGLAALSLVLIVATRWHRLNRAPKRPMAFSFVSAIALFGGMFVLTSLGAALARAIGRVEILEGDATSTLPIADLAKLMLGATLARAVGVGVYVFILRQARPPHPDRRAGLVISVAVGTAGLLLTWPLLLAVVSLGGMLIGAPQELIAHDTLRQLSGGSMTGWAAVLVAIVVIAAPIVEEVMYRGLLQEGLRRAGATPWQAILLASVFFACAHIGVVQPHALLGLFVLGLGLGWSYEKTGRLWAPIAMHMLFNAGNLIAARSI